MRIILWITFLTALCLSEVEAQYPHNNADPSSMTKVGVIKGIIQDSISNKAIEYATVGLYRQKDSSLVNGTVTDNTGAFTLNELPYGNYYLVANFIGYDKRKLTTVLITPQKASYDLGLIRLNPSVTHIGDVNVVAESQRIDYKIDKKVVNVSQDIVSSGGTVVNVLENTPSVQVDVEGNVSLRGNTNFQVLIDGKPSVIQGSEGLQQIPASAVQSVEIITSPSAKYDPDGASGIINVIMKKQKQSGVGGIINASVGTRQKYTSDFLLNFKKDKVNFYVGGEFADMKFHNSGKSDKRSYLGDTTQYTLSNGEGVFRRSLLNFKSGADFYINDKSTFSLSGGISKRNFERNSSSENSYYTLPSTVDSFYIDNSNSPHKHDYYNLNLDYQKKFKKEGQLLQSSFYFAKGNNVETDNQNVILTDSQFEPFINNPSQSRTTQTDKDNNIRFELNYTDPVNDKTRLELGLQSRWDIDKGSYAFENNPNDLNPEWIKVDSLTNTMDYLDAIQSAYGIYSGSFGKFEYQAGLRAEYDNRYLNQKTIGESYTYDKFHFFPSFYLIRKLTDDQQIQFTYSRRIERPDERDLNPFKDRWGTNTYRFGNPALKPEFTNAFELNYQNTFKAGMVSLETYFRQTNNKISPYSFTVVNDSSTIYYNTSINADHDYSLGMELMTNLNFTKWWQFNLTGNLYWYKTQGQIDASQTSKTSTIWTTNFSTSFKIKTDTRVQIMGVYNGPSITLQGKREGFFVTSLAIKQDLFKKQISLALNVRDIFATGSYAFTSEGSNFYQYNRWKREAPVVTLSLSYRINNYRQASKRNGQQDQQDNNGFEEGL